jgi:hypothetical protein
MSDKLCFKNYEYKDPKKSLFAIRMIFDLKELSDKQKLFAIKYFAYPNLSEDELVEGFEEELEKDENFAKKIYEEAKKLRDSI